MGCSNGGIKTETQAIFVMGGPFSGKSKQCELINKTFQWENISVKQVTKQELQQVEDAVKDLDVVSSVDMVSAIKSEISLKKIRRFLLDGFPTSVENINEWEKQLKEIEVLAVLYFKCSESTMKERMDSAATQRSINQGKVTVAIENFEKEVNSILSKYETEGKVITFDAEKSESEIFDEVKAAFIKKKFVE